tara:strand:- start:133 stop:1320 length:1188 start_codon:yes stop_codon:yes gene_type:complete
MGFFSKIFKGVKKVFKKIGRGIKKVVTGVGKFMNKIGIVGQMALMFLPLGPLVGGLLKGAGGLAAKALTAMGPIGNSILKGAQFVIGKAGKFVTAGKNAFGTITDGIGGFVKEFTKTGLNKLGLDPTKFGFADVGSSTFSEAWGKVTTDITSNASKILDPFKSSITADSATTLQGLSDSAYHSVDSIKQMNPQISDWGNIDGQLINLDPDFIPNQMVPTGGFKTPVTTQEQYDQFWKQAGSNMESKAVSELGSPKSLLAKYQQNPITGQMTEQSAIDFQKVLDSATKPPAVTDTVGGFFDTTAGGFAKDVGISAATNVATQGLMSAVAGDPPEAPISGYTVDAGNVQVTGAGGAVDYGIGGGQFLAASSRQPQATGLYDGSNTYAANLQAFYRLA